MKEHENDGQIRPLQDLRDHGIDWDRFEKDARRIVTKFRKKLTPEQNARWTDDHIVQAFLSLGNDAAYYDGAAAKQQLRDASSKALSQEPDFFQAVAQSAKLHDALKVSAFEFWSVVLKHADLAMERGKYMTDAAKGTGLLVSGGHNEEKISSMAAHWQENQDGGGTEFGNRFEASPKRRGNFVPGSGGMETWKGKAFGGRGKETMEPIFNVGHAPESEGDDPSESAEEIARRIREEWKQDMDRKLRSDAAD